MTTDFRVETASAGIAGVVIYRCAACHEPIPEREVVFLPPWDDEGETRTYHAEHAPKEDQ